MSTPNSANPTIGIIAILVAMLSISLNDLMIKALSGGYPLHELVFVRSAVGIMFSLVIVQLEGGWSILKTDKPFAHALRGILLVISNLTFFSALAALPLAETTALFFSAPLFITLLSIPMLGEKVGPLRLSAVLVGFVGVILMLRPWDRVEPTTYNQIVLFLPIVAALTYSMTQLLTRRLGATAKASVLAIYVQLAFIVVSVSFWAVAGDGRYAEGVTDPSLQFLLRPWIWPVGNDIYVFAALGLNSAIIGYAISQAYRSADAATIAPYEYVGLPLAVLWGYLIFAEWPEPEVFAGIALIIGAGLFVFLRERQKNRLVASRRPRSR